MYGSDAQNRSEVWKANVTSFTPENWDSKDPWSTTTVSGSQWLTPNTQSTRYQGWKRCDGVPRRSDYGEVTIAMSDTVTLTGTAGNDAADLRQTFAEDAVDPTYAVTDATRDGTTATATLGSKTAGDVTHDFEVGDEVNRRY